MNSSHSLDKAGAANQSPRDEFIFVGYAFDRQSYVLSLQYRYATGPNFEEKITFPQPVAEPSAAQWAAFDVVARLLFMVAGVSYYKAYVPEKISSALPLNQRTADFLYDVYLHGLGEFAYQNKLSLVEKINFPVSADAKPASSVRLPLAKGALVPVGGGKDSIVSIELLRDADKPLTLFALASTPVPAAPIQGTLEVAALPSCVAVRQLSPALIALNQSGAYNGHVPITAILSLIAVATAVLHGRQDVIMSNEHSASTPNLVQDGLEINHQYSKSFAFETALNEYIHDCISPDINYFSLLRPLTEVEIARRFSRLEKYHSVFRSCNTAFRQDVTARGKKWCCNCPKCRFVFLALANFVPKERLIAIFGENLLDDMTQRDGFAELCGIEAFKPFECVGEIEESALLLGRLTQLPEWQNDAVILNLAPLLKFKNFAAEYQGLFSLKEPHALPSDYKDLLHAAG